MLLGWSARLPSVCHVGVGTAAALCARSSRGLLTQEVDWLCFQGRYQS